MLRDEPELTSDLLNLGQACGELRDWIREASPELMPAFGVSDVTELPAMLAAESVRRWLIARAVPPDQILPRGSTVFLRWRTMPPVRA